MILARILLSILALVIILIGLIAMISPIPFGIILIAFGFVLLAIAAPGLIRSLRQRWQWLDSILDRYTDRLPKWLARRLKQSDPADSDGDKKDAKSSTDTTNIDDHTPNYHSARPTLPARQNRAEMARRILMK